MAPGYYVYGYSTFAYVPANGNEEDIPPFLKNFGAMNPAAEAVKSEVMDGGKQAGPASNAAGEQSGSAINAAGQQVGPVDTAAGQQTGSMDNSAGAGAPNAELTSPQPADEKTGPVSTEPSHKAEEPDDEIMSDIITDSDSDEEPAFTKPQPKGKAIQPATQVVEPVRPAKATPTLPRGTRRADTNRFRITMGLLPHSGKSSKVTAEMKDELEAKFFKLDETRQREFTDCLRNSVSQITVRKCISSNGFGSDNIDFRRLSYQAYHDLNLFLKVNQLDADKDGEGRKIRGLIGKVKEEDRERKAALEKAREGISEK